MLQTHNITLFTDVGDEIIGQNLAMFMTASWHWKGQQHDDLATNITFTYNKWIPIKVSSCLRVNCNNIGPWTSGPEPGFLATSNLVLARPILPSTFPEQSFIHLPNIISRYFVSLSWSTFKNSSLCKLRLPYKSQLRTNSHILIVYLIKNSIFNISCKWDSSSWSRLYFFLTFCTKVILRFMVPSLYFLRFWGQKSCFLSTGILIASSYEGGGSKKLSSVTSSDW